MSLTSWRSSRVRSPITPLLSNRTGTPPGLCTCWSTAYTSCGTGRTPVRNQVASFVDPAPDDSRVGGDL